MRDFFSVWRDVFTNWKFSMIAIVIALVFYSINVLISSYSSLISFYSQVGFFGTLKLFLTFFLGFKDHIEFHGFVTLILISIILGMLFSLIFYKTTMLKSFSGKSMGFFGTTGIFLGILAPGCAACGIGLLSALGLGTAALTSLPFEGLELSILAILILGFSTFKITKDINKGISCEIK